MHFRGLIFFGGLLLITGIIGSLAPGCANIIPPQGGPRDSLPPLLIKATPGDSTRNFTGNRISFTFNEFVELQNVNENLNVSPAPDLFPSVDYRLNTVTVKFKGQLEPNTTYSYNFGNSIRDFTEGNPLKNFTYTFSTGPYIDSLELGGRLIIAETGKPDSTLVIMLHTSANDSAVVNEKPRYVTRPDGQGNFIFRNLPPKTFYIYALKDEGGTRRYFDEKQLFAFADSAVVPGLNPTPVTLFAWSVKPPAPVAPASTGISIGNRLNRTGGITPDNRLRYQTNITAGLQDLLIPFTLSFDQPLRKFDSAGIRLFTDSVYTAVAGYRTRIDSSSRKITLEVNWKENTAYHLILDKDFADDSSGKKLLKTDTLHFTTKKLADYGSLDLKFRNLDMSKNPVLLFLTGETVVRTVTLTTPNWSQSLFLPGDYDLRILFDENKNGKWDPGQFFGGRRQPERVLPVSRKITVKPAWQNEIEITL